MLGIILIGVIIVISIFIISLFNSLVRLKNDIDKSWSNIDVVLKQRHDELNNLMNCVKGYMKHEKEVLTQVTKARTSFIKAQTIKEKAGADNMMTSTIKSIFAVAENYPSLLANEQFIKLQNRISVIENTIADKREFYNDSVNTFNTKIEQIPSIFIANIFHYKKQELFKTEDKTSKINFTQET